MTSLQELDKKLDWIAYEIVQLRFNYFHGIPDNYLESYHEVFGEEKKWKYAK